MPAFDQGPMSMYTDPLVKGWFTLIESARSAKQGFIDNAEMCKAFYEKPSGFMWEDPFRERYLGKSVKRPKFNVTVNTAFEYVQLFRPRLAWTQPKRGVVRPERPQFDLESLAQGDEMRAMWLQQMAQFQMADDAVMGTRTAIWDAYLNDTPEHQPYGTLEQHSGYNIDEALVTGRGVMVPRAYQCYTDSRVGTGSFYTSNKNLFVDADTTDQLWMDSKWIGLRHVEPYWEVERKFGWPAGSLRDKGHFFTGQMPTANRPGVTQPQKPDSPTSRDLIEWYEIWSKCGVGSRWSKTYSSMSSVWDEIAGDHAYICVANTVRCPLNLPAGWLGSPEATVDSIREKLSWPVPYYKADLWPVSKIDFCTSFIKGAWPLAPLAAAMGEMICLQILLSYYLQNAEANSQQIIAYFESIAEKLEEQLQKGTTPVAVRLHDSMHQPINDVIAFLNRPNMNTDGLQAMQFVMQLIERKTMLTPMMYAQVPETQPRSAAQSTAMQSNMTLVPDYMAKLVAAQQADLANKERMCAYYSVGGKDIEPRLGPLTAALWDQLIVTEDEDSVLRTTTCVVKASDLRKPDQDKNAQNLNQLGVAWLPVAMEKARLTGDFTQIDQYIARIGEATELDVSGMQLGMIPPPPPEGQPTEGEQAAEEAKLQQDAEKHDLAVAGTVQKIRQEREMHQVKVQATKAKAKAAARKPSANGSRT